MASILSAPVTPVTPVGRHRAVSVELPATAVYADRGLAVVVPVLRGAGRVVVGLLLLLGLAMFLFLAVGPHVLGYRNATMLTGSMEPGISPGDVIVSVERPASEVVVGDVITYHIPVEDHRVETHRVVEVLHGAEGAVAVRTQGDANEGVDPWVATLEGETVWELRGVVPYLGDAVRFLRTPVVHQVVLWGGLGAVLVLGLRRIWRGED